ncbi:MAG: hypothetical protein RIS70_2449 [Planctomycetota bacterium]
MRRSVLFARLCLTLLFGLFAAVSLAADRAPITAIEVHPAEIQLTGPAAVQGLLVTGRREDGRLVDLTRAATYATTDAAIVRIDARGEASGVHDGTATVEIKFDRFTHSVPVRVSESSVPRALHFENDIVPLLSKFGCNTSACHGKAEGQNGFKLSVFGSDPLADLDALTKEGRGRRTRVAIPERSLLLLKASGETPHGGGARIARGSREYDVMRDWIAAGVPQGDANAPHVVRLEIFPKERTLDLGAKQQLRTVAEYSDGRRVDVTGLTRFQSNSDALATVDETGFIEVGQSPGQVAIMASFMGAVDTFQALLPRVEAIADYPAQTESNFIDRLVNTKLKKLNIVPSGMSDDAEFMRRVYVDVIGTLPTPAESRAFLSDASPGKRQQLVARLLDRPEYADYWSQRWADLLRVDRRALGHKGAYAYYRWIHQQFENNTPYDRFARELITASGTLDQSPQARFYQVSGTPGDTASTLSQVFLGVRISCAQCHHHPFDRWSQDDYYGMAAFFQPLSRKGTPRGEMMVAAGISKATNPRSGKEVMAHPLSMQTADKPPEGDARDRLADWMTSPNNPWFARNVANRIWAHFLGRGIVEPVDDMRETNPPTNPELLDGIAQHLVDQKFDLKQLILTITASQTYQRNSQPNATNELDEQNYSRALLKRIDAEVLMDAVCQVTGIEEKYEGVPSGYRAIQLWDSEVEHYFLKLFGRPTRKTACECERNSEPNVGQVLHVLNSPEIQSKLSHEAGRVRKLAATIQDNGALADELYLVFFARLPTAAERQTAVEALSRAGVDRRAAAEDVAWSLMNSLEFIFNH